MNVRMRRIFVIGLVAVFCTICAAGFAKPPKANSDTVVKQPTDKAASAPAPAADNAPVPTMAGGYKIGVVNRKAVVKAYKKVETEYAKLQKEVETRQKVIDGMSTEIEGMKKAYEDKKKDMSPADRVEKEAEIQNKFNTYRAQLTKDQNYIDGKENELMKSVLSEINEAVKKVAEKGAYHIIFDGSTSAGAIYFSSTVDVSSQVIDVLNASVK